MLTYTLTLAGGDLSCAAYEASLSWGRSGLGEQPSARTLTLTIHDPTAAHYWTADIGTSVLLAVTASTFTGTRFTGTVTDRAHDPATSTTTVSAVSPLAALGRTMIASTPLPEQVDGTRAAAILELAGAHYVTDPGRFTLGTVDFDNRAALDALHDTAASAGAVVVDLHDGTIAYQDIDHRRGASDPWQSSYAAVTLEHPTYADTLADHPTYHDLYRTPHPHPPDDPGLILSACDLHAELTTRTNALTNDVDIRYGPEHAATEKLTDYASVGRYGRHALKLDTLLLTPEQAQEYAATILARRAAPSNVLAVTLDTPDLTPELVLADYLALEAGDTMQLIDLPPTVTPSGSPVTQLVLEGARETYAAGTMTATLATSTFTAQWIATYADLTTSTYADLTTKHTDYADLLIHGRL